MVLTDSDKIRLVEDHYRSFWEGDLQDFDRHGEQNRQLMTKIAGALRPRGLIVGQDYLRTDPPDAFHAAFSLIMFSENGTRTYTYEELGGWLSEARFESLERFDLPPTGQSSIVTATRADRAGVGS